MRISALGAWSGGTVVDLAVHSDTVLAATFAGIFRSIDGGHSWLPVGANLPDWFIQAVVLASTGTQTVGLAASHLGWLYRSADGGETWEIASYWQGLGIVTRLVASPSFESDGIVFACTEEDGILKSVDRGGSWKQASFGLLNLSVSSLCFSPNFEQDEVVFAGTDGGGLFRSRNAGRAWRESGEGLPDSAVQSLAVSPAFAEDGVVLVGTEDYGLFRSTDGGRTWSRLGEALTEACVNSLYLSPGWDAGGYTVAATDEGILFSADGGHTWQETEGGVDYPYVLSLCRRELLVGAYEDGIYRSANGTAWQASNGDLAAHLPPVVCFSDAFERDLTLLMASMEGTLVRSMDAGQTWEMLRKDQEYGVSSLAGKGKGEAMVLLAATEGGLMRSRDSGTSWEGVLDTGGIPPVSLALSETYDQDNIALAGTSDGQVLLSRDGGASWEQAALLPDEMVVALTARTGDTGTMMYAVTARQSDTGAWQLALRNGTSWQVMLARESNEAAAMLCPLDGGGLLCALGARAMYLRGEELIGESVLEGEAAISSLAVDGNDFLVGTRLGIYRSMDQAQSWERLTSDLSAVALRTVERKVYAVSMGGRLWQLDLS